ncbi:hypothetical protein ACXWTF_00560 [Thiomicrolovo sp. ZZH C-3]
MKAALLIGAPALFTAIQIIPFGHDHMHPPVVTKPVQDIPKEKTRLISG